MNLKTMTGAELIEQVESALEEIKCRYTTSTAAAVEIVKTANQQRAELIQRSKEFMKAKIYRRREFCGLDGDNISVDYKFLKLNFVVNAEKRTVVALLFFPDGIIYRRAIAKCMPDEVFNECIGKAIALARVLEVDIPSVFLNAVQPDEIVVGMIVKRYNHKGYFLNEKTVKRLTNKGSVGTLIDDSNLYTPSYGDHIVDDTNADYSHVS